MAKNTYAYQATKIMNKYKKRLGDNFTKRDILAEKGLELEMNRLKDEQEAVKESMAFDEEFGQFEQLAYGGPIKIKKSNVGKFTAAAKKRGMGVQEFANKVMANKENYSPTLVKRANFAKNAAKWKKETGGNLVEEQKKQQYNDLKDFVKIARQAIGKNDTDTLKKLKLDKPYNSNDLAIDFHKLQELRKELGYGIREEASILFPHVGQQIRGAANSMMGTHYKYGGSLLPKAKFGFDLNSLNTVANNGEDYLIAQEEAAREQANLDWALSQNRPTDFTGNETDIGYTPTDYTPYMNFSDIKLPKREQDKYYNPTLGGTSIIPLATSVAGNLLMYNRAKPTTIKYDRITPETISLASERDQARKDAELARNINLRNARNLGLSAGASATMGIGTISDINRVSGERIGKSYLQEQLANKQSKELANRINAEIAMREADANLREKDITESMKDQAIQNIIQSTGQYFSDVQKAKESNQWKNIYSPTYKLYEDPNQSWIDRLLFGQSAIGKQDTSQYRP